MTDTVDTSAISLGFGITLETAAIRIVLVVLLTVLNGIGNKRCANDIVARLRLCDVEAVEDNIVLVSLELRVDWVLEKCVAHGGLERRDPIVCVTRDLNMTHDLGINDLVDESAALRGKVVGAATSSC